MKKLLLILSCITLIVSCATIPVPTEENEAMAVLVTEFRKETEYKPFGYYMFEISNEESGYKKYVKVSRNQNYYLTGLEPGEYKVSYIFVYDNGKRGSRDEMFSFMVRKGKTHIISKKIIVRIYEEAHKNMAWMTRFSESISISDLEKMTEELIAEHPELAEWDWE